MTQFTFFLDWILSAQFAGLCWAQAKGLYQDAGLEVNFIPWMESNRSICDQVLEFGMHAGACAGSSEDNLVVLAQSQGKPLKIVGTMFQDPLLVVMSKPERKIRFLSDLEGKRVGMHSDGIEVFKILLQLEGISNVDVQEVAFDYDNLLQDRFDAVQGYVVAEPIELAARGQEVSWIPVRHQQLNPYAQVFFTSDHCIETHPDILKAFLWASWQGWRQAMSDLEAAAHCVAELIGDPQSFPKQLQILERVKPLVLGSGGLETIGQINPSQWQRNLETYAQFGLISQPLKLEDVIDQQFGISLAL